MSWSCNVTNTIEHVKQYVEAELERYINMYDGYHTPDGDAEAQDCRDAKRAILARIDAIDLSPNSLAPVGFLVAVSAYGSRSSDGTMSSHVSVSKQIVPATGG